MNDFEFAATQLISGDSPEFATEILVAEHGDRRGVLGRVGFPLGEVDKSNAVEESGIDPSHTHAPDAVAGPNYVNTGSVSEHLGERIDWKRIDCSFVEHE
mgnify:CR=1 FL=1